MQTRELMTVIDEGATDYATYVISNRHFVDFRDGLKPVNRCALWALKEENSGPEKAFTKTLQIAGTVTGLYHPHNSEAVSAAIALLTQTRAPCAPLEGEGSFGGYNSDPSSPRYTSIRLSKYGRTFVDPEYLNFVPHRTNYTGAKTFPMYLPALLPNLLLNGGSGVGYGLSFSAPPFTIKSVRKLIDKAVKNNGDVTVTDCKKLELFSRYPTEHDPKELWQFYETGKSTLRVFPKINISRDGVIVSGFDENIQYMTFVKACNESDDIISVQNMSDQNINIIIKARRGQHENVAKTVRRLLSVSYGLSNVLIKYLPLQSQGDNDDRIPFSWDLFTLPQFIKQWVEYRGDIEKKSLVARIEKMRQDHQRIDILIEARNRLDEISDLLRRKLTTPDLIAKLCALLKCDENHARLILDTTLRQLSHADIAKLRERQKALRDAIKTMQNNLNEPVRHLATTLAGLFDNI